MPLNIIIRAEWPNIDLAKEQQLEGEGLFIVPFKLEQGPMQHIGPGSIIYLSVDQKIRYACILVDHHFAEFHEKKFYLRKMLFLRWIGLREVDSFESISINFYRRWAYASICPSPLQTERDTVLLEDYRQSIIEERRGLNGFS